jgi:hypothetical protein
LWRKLSSHLRPRGAPNLRKALIWDVVLRRVQFEGLKKSTSRFRPGCPSAVTELCLCGDLKWAKTIERSFETSRRGRVEGLRKSTSRFETWMP